MITVAVRPTAAYLNASCGNASFAYGGTYYCNVNTGSNSGAAQGVITYTLDDGAPIPVPLTGGSAAFSVTGLVVGPHTVVIGYAAQGNVAAANPSIKNFTVTQALTQSQLTPSNYYPTTGSSFTLTASVRSSTGGPPATGLMTFLDNGTSMGVIAVNSAGHAGLTISSLAGGYHSFVAQYSGVMNFAAGTSNYVSISAR
jgi:hypothetical protein